MAQIKINPNTPIKGDRKRFVHCPRPNCDEPLEGSWKDYLTGEKHPKTGMPVYQCPKCGLKFTADSFKANAIPVPDNDNDIILYDTVSRTIVDVISHRLKFTDGSFCYIHLPYSICTRNEIRAFSFKAHNLSYKEMSDLCEEAINQKVEVFR